MLQQFITHSSAEPRILPEKLPFRGSLRKKSSITGCGEHKAGRTGTFSEAAGRARLRPGLLSLARLLPQTVSSLVLSLLFAVATIPLVRGAEGTIETAALETSDGVGLSLSFYPPAGDSIATVLLVHDVGGSHASVRELATGLQRAGCAVAVPDLRGSGGSTGGGQRAGGSSLKRNELLMIAGAGGGSIRSQARIRGDLETVRNWLKAKEQEGDVDLERFCVIGSGLGGTLAALWTAADWGWQPITRGPQGQDVDGLILISPVWADKGISINKALGARALIDRRPVKPLLEHLPVMIIAGEDDSQAERLFKTFQQARPTSWYQQLADGTKSQADSERRGATGPIVFVQIKSILRADKLATLPTGDRTPDRICNWFISDVLGKE